MSKFRSTMIVDGLIYKRIADDPDGCPHYRAVERRLIVCLCGSTRFREAFEQAARDETLAGRIYLSVGMFGHQEGLDMNGAVKAGLDELHLDKIDLADEVLILNVGGYVGDSTRREVLYAHEQGKTIRWLEPFAVPADLAHVGDSLSNGPKVHRDRDDDPDRVGY